MKYIKQERIKELATLAFTKPLSVEEYIARMIYLVKTVTFKATKVTSIKLMHQLNLLEEEKWNVLIILDACRYDTFKQLIFEFIHGTLFPVLSSGSITFDWFVNTWCNSKHKNNVYYISANPYIRKDDPSISKCVYKVLDAWKMFWVKEKMSVDVKDVLNFSKIVLRMYSKDLKNSRLKLVIHLLQPHAPYNHWPSVFNELWKLGAPYNITTIFSLYRKDKHTVDILRASYIKNLRYTLINIAKFIHEIHQQYSNDIKIVITSDHGELFGEYGLLFHPNIEVPELRIVPWFVVR